MEKISVPQHLQELTEPHFIPGFNREVKNYQIEEPIGSGGEAVVYRGFAARQRDEPVAVKVSPASTPDQAQRLRAEADIIKAIHDHPGIVKTHWHSTYVQTLRTTGRFGQKQKIIRNYPYAVMEFMDGGTLDARMRTSVVSTREIVSVLGQVLSAVSWAHGEDDRSRTRVIHRDIKPSNVLFTSIEPAPILPGFPDLGQTDCAKISDFGIAIGAPGQIINGKERTITATQVGAGTFNYMPPEQIDSKAQPQSDDYAIAVMTYRLITGRFPIVLSEAELQNQSPLVCWVEKAQDDANLTPLSEANPERMDTVLEALEEPIMTSLRSNWRGRYSQTADFQEAVRLAVHKGLAAHRRDKRYFDMTKPWPGAYKPQPEPEGWPQVPGLSLDNPIAQEVIPRMATESLPRPPDPEQTPPTLMSRRGLLGSIGSIGGLAAIGALTALIRSSEAPESVETPAERQVIADAAKEVIRIMEARNLRQHTSLILKHLIPYDDQYVLGKVRQMQTGGDGEAAWLAAALATYEPRAVGDILQRYTDGKQYTEMAIVGAALSIAAESLPFSTASGDIYPAANDPVREATSACASVQRRNDAYTIAAATSVGAFELTGFPPAVYTTDVLHQFQADAPSDTSLFTNIRALGTAIAPNPMFTSSVKEMLENYSQTAGASGGLAEYIYPLTRHLASALAPRDASASGNALSKMAQSSEGIAAETAWTLAIELAPFNSKAVGAYISARPSQLVPHIAAVALAGNAPERAKHLRATAPPLVQKWIDAALYPRDGRSVATVVNDLTNGPDSGILDELGAELTAALLLSRKVI